MTTIEKPFKMIVELIRFSLIVFQPTKNVFSTLMTTKTVHILMFKENVAMKTIRCEFIQIVVNYICDYVLLPNILNEEGIELL